MRKEKCELKWEIEDESVDRERVKGGLNLQMETEDERGRNYSSEIEKEAIELGFHAEDIDMVLQSMMPHDWEIGAALNILLSGSTLYTLFLSTRVIIKYYL